MEMSDLLNCLDRLNEAVLNISKTNKDYYAKLVLNGAMNDVTVNVYSTKDSKVSVDSESAYLHNEYQIEECINFLNEYVIK